jgi:hypothetical protein
MKYTSIDFFKNKAHPEPMGIFSPTNFRETKLPKIESPKKDLGKELQDKRVLKIEKKNILFYQPKKDYLRLKKLSPKSDQEKFLNLQQTYSNGRISSDLKLDSPYFPSERGHYVKTNNGKRDHMTGSFSNPSLYGDIFKDHDEKLNKLNEVLSEKDTQIEALKKALVHTYSQSNYKNDANRRLERKTRDYENLVTTYKDLEEKYNALSNMKDNKFLLVPFVPRRKKLSSAEDFLQAEDAKRVTIEDVRPIGIQRCNL